MSNVRRALREYFESNGALRPLMSADFMVFGIGLLFLLFYYFSIIPTRSDIFLALGVLLFWFGILLSIAKTGDISLVSGLGLYAVIHLVRFIIACTVSARGYGFFGFYSLVSVAVASLLLTLIIRNSEYFKELMKKSRQAQPPQYFAPQQQYYAPYPQNNAPPRQSYMQQPQYYAPPQQNDAPAYTLRTPAAPASAVSAPVAPVPSSSAPVLDTVPCPACGKQVLNTKKFCTFCGKIMDGPKRCTQCGSTLLEGKTVCVVCGAPAASGLSAAPVQAAPIQTPPIQAAPVRPAPEPAAIHTPSNTGVQTEKLSQEPDGGKKICPSCSAVLPPNRIFCTKCGYRFPEKAPETVAPMNPPATAAITMPQVEQRQPLPAKVMPEAPTGFDAFQPEQDDTLPPAFPSGVQYTSPAAAPAAAPATYAAPSDTKVCPSCGASGPSDKRFCAKCGYRF